MNSVEVQTTISDLNEELVDVKLGAEGLAQQVTELESENDRLTTEVSTLRAQLEAERAWWLQRVLSLKRLAAQAWGVPEQQVWQPHWPQAQFGVQPLPPLGSAAPTAAPADSPEPLTPPTWIQAEPHSQQQS